MLEAVVSAGRVIAEVAAAHGLSWWTVQRTVTGAAEKLTDPDTVPVRRLGIDEHRYRRVRYFRDPDGGWRRYEPWMTTFVDADTGRVLGVVDAPRLRRRRDLAGRPQPRVAGSGRGGPDRPVGGVSPGGARAAAGRRSVDAFHLVKLANDMLTAVRQRVTRERKGRRGRRVDPAWTNRRLLLGAGDTVSAAALARLPAILCSDDPTGEIGAAWGVKEQLRRLLASGSLAEAREQKMLLGLYVLAADMPETERLWATISDW